MNLIFISFYCIIFRFVEKYMIYTVYILLSEKDNRLYVGCTSNLENRLLKHKNGLVRSTKNRRPVELIHKEYFREKSSAFNRERFLKSLWGSREKNKIKEKYLNSINHKHT